MEISRFPADLDKVQKLEVLLMTFFWAVGHQFNCFCSLTDELGKSNLSHLNKTCKQKEQAKIEPTFGFQITSYLV